MCRVVVYFLFLVISTAHAQDNMFQMVDRAGSHYQEYKTIKTNIRKSIRKTLRLDEDMEAYFMFILPAVTGRVNIKYLKNLRHKHQDNKIKLVLQPLLEYNIRRDEILAGARLTIDF